MRRNGVEKSRIEQVKMVQALGYKTTDRVPIGFYVCIFIFFLNSMGLWIGWAGRDKWIDLVTLALILLSLYNYYYIKFDFCTRNFLLTFVLFVSSIIYTKEFGFRLLLNFIIYFIICCLNSKYQIQCLHYVFKWFAWLMLPGILVYFLVQAGLMASFGTLNTIDNVLHSFYDTSYTVRSNYIFYCAADGYGIRFNGPFVEPGHLGMMSAFLLYADGFDFKKKETWIVLLALFMTISLSGYVLVFFAYLFFKYEKYEIQAQFIVIFLIFVFFIYLVGMFYNGGDNLLNEMIFSRLEYDEEKGFSGNNRVFGQIDLYYAAMFNNTHTLLYGYDKEIIEYLAWNNSRGTGFVMSMVTRGIIGTIAGIIFYVIYCLYKKNKRTAVLFLVFVLMLYWQRSYSFWFSWIICFVFGISNRNVLLCKSEF